MRINSKFRIGNPGKFIFKKLIRFYQLAISPYKGGNMCKYYPTCSHYALEAIEGYGVIKGGFMALKRILRCNPVSKGGYDPVPIRVKYYKK